MIEELRRLQEEMPKDARRAGCFAGCALAAAAGLGAGRCDSQLDLERLYNAEWALTTQLEIISRQFDEMDDDLRERKA
ncbi:hypothetical protein J4711_14295 [Staphylococcus epidermidis]|nr:hypothetical protein [Staphylococcus epidermidis]